MVPTHLNCELSHVGLVEMAFQLMAFQVIQRLALVEGRSRFPNPMTGVLIRLRKLEHTENMM